MNHSYVDLSLVGGSQSDRISCHTDLPTCCSSAQGPDRGDWFFPNGTRLPFQITGDDIVEDRGAERVDLIRRNNRNVSGIYYCNIIVRSGSELVYIGLYDMGGKFMPIELSIFVFIGILGGPYGMYRYNTYMYAGPATFVYIKCLKMELVSYFYSNS